MERTNNDDIVPGFAGVDQVVFHCDPNAARDCAQGEIGYLLLQL